MTYVNGKEASSVLFVGPDGRDVDEYLPRLLWQKEQRIAKLSSRRIERNGRFAPVKTEAESVHCKYKRAQC